MKCFCKPPAALCSVVAAVFLGLAAASAARTAPAADKDAEIGRKALELLRSATKHEDSDIRVLALEQWGEIGSEAAAPLLRRALRDSSKYVRIAAASSLYQLGDTSGVAVLESIVSERPGAGGPRKGALSALEELKAMGRDKVRVAAIAALARTGAPDARRVLVRAKKDPSGSVRDAAMAALARLGDEEALARLVEALKDDDAGVRLAAVRALGEVGGPEVLEPLKPAAKDASDEVRAAAMEALGASGEGAALEPLTAGITDESILVRAKAVEALGRLGSAAAAPLLKSARRRSTNAVVQLKALWGLARLGEEVDLGLAERSLSQKDSDTKMVAVEAAEAAGGEAGVMVLSAALEDNDMRVRVRAAAAVIKVLRRLREGAR